MNSPQFAATFQARQCERTGEAMAVHVIKLARLIERLREDCEIIAADPETFGTGEREAYRKCVETLTIVEGGLGRLSTRLIEHGATDE